MLPFLEGKFRIYNIRAPILNYFLDHERDYYTSISTIKGLIHVHLELLSNKVYIILQNQSIWNTLVCSF